jgi:Uma2 family endonuclease
LATVSGLMTVEEFRRLPEDGSFYYELHHGEAVRVSRPKLRHYCIQHFFLHKLTAVAGDRGFIGLEFNFRALPEYEFRVADVAFVSQERWSEINLDDDFHGVPDLVIEILSPSNTASQILEKERLCLKNGAREFWSADPATRLVRVSTPDGNSHTYALGEEIPLTVIGSGTLKVDEIFA